MINFIIYQIYCNMKITCQLRPIYYILKWEFRINIFSVKNRYKLQNIKSKLYFWIHTIFSKIDNLLKYLLKKELKYFNLKIYFINIALVIQKYYSFN